jgi:hypothetical protein
MAASWKVTAVLVVLVHALSLAAATRGLTGTGSTTVAAAVVRARTSHTHT